jgi:CRP/FNR family transcriptional regulator, cyclic AMP receptor protein
VNVSLIHEDGRTVILDSLKEGDFFGELSVLDGRSRSAMVTASTDVKMLFLPREKFLKILNEKPEIAITILSVMANRLRKANESIETLTFLDVAGRVSKFILDLARECDEDHDGHVKVQCPTHQEIAGRIGASREAVTKALKSLISNGLITMQRKEVIVSPKQFEIL